MGRTLEEIDRQPTPLGELLLRARRSPSLGGGRVYEVLLDGAFLMSSAVDHSETALADRALAALDDRPATLLVGGLGLGHTASAALRDARVHRLDAVETLAPVLDWHRRGLVPAAEALTSDPRCHLVHDDFFELIRRRDTGRYDAILVDIDHSPSSRLDAAHGRFYSEAGLADLTDHLHPGGVFVLWSAEPVEEAFLTRLRRVFPDVRVHPIAYHHSMLHREECDHVVVASVGGRSVDRAAEPG